MTGPLVDFLADAVNGLAADGCLYIIIDNFISAAGAFDALDLGDLVLERCLGQINLLFECREIFSFEFADDIVFFIDYFIGQLDFRCIDVIMQRDRGVFLHLGLFAVDDHIIGNSFLVELVNDFLLLRCSLLGGAFFCRFR